MQNKIVDNESLTFLLPLLSTPRFHKQFFINNHFIGTFIGDTDRYHYDNEILLVYKKTNTLPFYIFEVELMKHPLFTNIFYDYFESGLTVYVFKIPDSMEETYQHIIQGNYRRIDQKFKNKITTFWNKIIDTTEKSYKIFYDKENLKPYWDKKPISREDVCNEGEVWPPPLLEHELFYSDTF